MNQQPAGFLVQGIQESHSSSSALASLCHAYAPFQSYELALATIKGNSEFGSNPTILERNQMRNQLTLLLCFTVIPGVASANSQPAAKVSLSDNLDQRRVSVGLDFVQSQASPKLVQPRETAEWLGESVVVGTTRYDYQHNGSTSKMLAVSANGMVHGSFMGGIDAGANRRVKGYCVDTDLTVNPETDVLADRTGYTTSAVTGPDAATPNSGVVGMHTGTQSWINLDFAGCTLAFNSLSHTGDDILWPHVAVDGQNQLHMVSYGTGDSAYPNTVFYDVTPDGFSWTNGDYLVVTDDSEGLGAIPVANNHTNKVALLYFDKTGPEDIPFDGSPDPEIGVQIHHDVKAYLNDSGDISSEILAGNDINLTNYGADSDAPFGKYGTRAYCDVDGLFDMTAEENLHMVFSAVTMFTDTLNLYDGDGDYSELVYYNWNLGKGQIWHLNAGTGEWSHVAGYNSGITDEDYVFDRPQGWRMYQDRPQIAIDPDTGYLYVIWSQFFADDQSDVDPDDDSSPYLNGEIFARCSADNGATWGPAVNLTNTSTPNCVTGECDAEDWPSMASIADDGYLHISFVHDLDAGGIPFDPPEGEQTLNDMIYMRVPVEDVPPHDGTPWDAAGHVGLVTETQWDYNFTCDAWVGETAYLDSAHWIDPIHVFNESPYDVTVDAISIYKHPSDLIGAPEDLGLMQLDLEVWTGSSWIPVAGWDGVLDQWAGTKFRIQASYSGLPNYDQLVVFHFNDREDLVYRLDYQDTDDTGCTGVSMLDRNSLGDYDELSQFTVDVRDRAVPGEFMLSQNYPNPFNPSTEIAFNLPSAGTANLAVYNLLGEKVATIIDGRMDAGFHTVTFDAGSLASGVYVYTLQTAGKVESRKMVLLK